jgi:hypothetical protein
MGRFRLNAAVSLALQIPFFAAFGAALLLVESDHTPSSAEFRDTPRFIVWGMVFTAMTATWPVLFRFGRDRLREVVPYVTRRRTAWECVRVLALLLVLAAFWGAPQAAQDRADVGLWGHEVRTGIAVLGGLIAAIPCLLTIWRVHDAVAPDVRERASALDMIKRLIALRGVFTASLAALGVLVMEATLASGALRNALIQWRPSTTNRFPAELVLLYGGFFTALLAAAAIPTYGRLHRRAAAVVEVLFPPLNPGSDGHWQKRLQERQDLSAYVQADSGPLQSFQATVLVAGPLLTGLLSLLIPTRA